MFDVYLFLDSNENNTASNSTLNLLSDKKLLKNSYSTISSLTSLIPAPTLKTGSYDENNLNKIDRNNIDEELENKIPFDC